MKFAPHGIVALIALLIASTSMQAADRKDPAKVSVTALTDGTQAQAGPTEGMNLVWWIPIEFWEVSLTQDDTMTPGQRQEFIEALSPYQILCVVRADVSNLGSFTFHHESTVLRNMNARWVDAEGKSTELRPGEQISPEARALVGAIRPILQGALGPMGENMHLFVFEAEDDEGRRIASPYERGEIVVELKPVGNEAGGTVSIETPLDALHVPRNCRKCGEEAHVRWKFCPWCGSDLPEHDD